jgi:hypothetical protein
VAYSVRGSISTKAISLLFPAVGLLYAYRVGGRRLQLGLAAALLLTTLAKFPVFYGSDYVIGPGSEGVSLADAASGRAWLGQHVGKPSPSVIADLSLYGKVLLAAPDPPSPVLNGLTADRFAYIVGANTGLWSDAPDLVLIDTQSTQPSLGFVFQTFRPLGDYLQQIQGNPAVNIIYDSGSLLIVQPRRQDK